MSHCNSHQNSNWNFKRGNRLEYSSGRENVQERVRKLEKKLQFGGWEETFSKPNEVQTAPGQSLRETCGHVGYRRHFKLVVKEYTGGSQSVARATLRVPEILSGKPPGQDYFPIDAKTLFTSLDAILYFGGFLWRLQDARLMSSLSSE